MKPDRVILILTILLLSFTLLLINCGGEGSSGGSNEPLSFFEEELVSKWSRYHAYDDSTDYFIFKSDRTGCFFTITSSYSRVDQSKYVYWGLDEDNPVGNNVFLIQYRRADQTEIYTSSHEYHYNEDVIWYGGYSNLSMGHSSTSYDCE